MKRLDKGLRNIGVCIAAVAMLVLGTLQFITVGCLLVYGVVTAMYPGIEVAVLPASAVAPENPKAQQQVVTGHWNGMTLRVCPQWESDLVAPPPPEIIITSSQYTVDRFMEDLGLPPPRLKLDCKNPDLIHRFWDGKDGITSKLDVAPGRKGAVKKALEGPIL